MRKSYWTHVVFVGSESELGKEHEVKRHVTTGRLGCSCMAYRFAPAERKTCKHIGVLGALAVASQYIDPRVVAAPVRVRHGGETFAVRRAISFENLTA